ncbi:uncharacterized protein LOC119365091 [Triticum dicoccoides]|uniref:uncharacterized protein LOC119365091 n=1 Tax=Triticum dicoccoides TaxID=85692 RepID=UPI000E78F53A|nr:uncharacterized protein LOC119365091 [Triticum dicoccoides]XP_044325446.1 uncharacterized protein LOC123046205 [Triticum aestivum]
MGRGRRSSLVRPTAVMALLGTPQGRQPQSSPRTESMADGSSTGLLGLPLGSRGTAAGGHTARRTRAPAAARLLPCVWSEREQGATRRLVLVQYVVPVVLVVGAVRKHAVCGGDLLHHSRPTITATLFPWLPPSLLCKLPPPSNTTLFLVKGMLLRPQWVSVVLPSPGSGARVENCYFFSRSSVHRLLVVHFVVILCRRQGLQQKLKHSPGYDAAAGCPHVLLFPCQIHSASPDMMYVQFSSRVQGSTLHRAPRIPNCNSLLDSEKGCCAIF